MAKQPSERVALVATVDPDAYAAATTYNRTSDWVDCRGFAALLAVVYAGDIGASGKIDAKLQQASSSTGSGAKDITGKAITQLNTTVAASGDSDKQALINLLTDELDVAGGFRWVRLACRSQTSATDFGAAVYGLSPRYGPANDYDLASVDEIVT